MANSITRALDGTENVFDAFLKFFGEFIKGMIIKLVAATIAALALAVVLSAIGFTAKGATSAMKFGDIFGKGFNMFSGMGMSQGGEVPSGYPNDTYPALLTSGERVTPPGKLPGNNKQGSKFEVITKITAREMLVLIREAERMNDNSF